MDTFKCICGHEFEIRRVMDDNCEWNNKDSFTFFHLCPACNSIIEETYDRTETKFTREYN